MKWFLLVFLCLGIVSCGNNEIVLPLNRTYDPMGQNSFSYGSMHVGKNQISWEKGPSSKYKVLQSNKDLLIIEFTGPIDFDGKKYRYARFTEFDSNEKLYMVGIELSDTIEGLDKDPELLFPYATSVGFGEKLGTRGAW